MAYVKPQVLVFQEFAVVPAALTDPLRAFIVGPQAGLHRYAVAAEKLRIGLGAYDPDADTAYAWPDQATGSVIDLASADLRIDDAMLRYFTDAVGTGSTIAQVSGYRNRIRSSAVVFATNAAADASAAFLDRGVKVGDRAYVRGVGSDSAVHELDTYVRGFVGEVTAATRAAATAASTNATAQGAATSVDKVAGADNTVTLTVDASLYDGTPDGDIDETYTVEVTQGSTGGDFSTARLRVTSASGNDNDLTVTPAGVGGFTAIGSRGLQVEFDRNETASASSAAVDDGASPDDLVAGQTWWVRVVQAFTPPTATSSGTYTGPADTTYIVEVTKGGPVGGATAPEVTVSTTTGVDVSGPTPVLTLGAAVAVGHYGVAVAFSGGTKLKAKDKYYIVVTAAGVGALQTLVLGHDLPTQLAATADLHLELSIRKNLTVPANRTGAAPLTNWEATQQEFTTHAGITAFDASWTDAGVQQPLDVTGGELYLQYREWLPTNVGQVVSATDLSDVAELAGTIDPDNPLAYALSKALANANGTVVKFTAVADPADTDAWAEALATVDGKDGVYSLVPLSTDRAVHDLFAAHVAANSGETQGLWRACFVPLSVATTVPVVSAATSSDAGVVLATLADDPATTGTQYTLLSVTSGNADLDALGVRAGDVVRYLYTTDGFGNDLYTSFTVADVRSEGTLVLAAGHSVAIPVAQKVEIWRTRRRSELATAVAATAASYGSRRVCAVWPDTVRADGQVVPGYHLCAALAGLRSGVVPHQGLTNVEIAGFESVPRTTELFTGSQLDEIAAAGGWIVTADTSGLIITRHALTTATATGLLTSQEEQIRVNVDSMSYVFLSQLKPFIGRANITPTTINQIDTTLRAVIEFLKSRGFTESLGGQLTDGTVVSVKQHAIYRDRLVVILSLTLPYPINNIELYLQV